MSVTYCGKTCEDCGYREELVCPGCKLGPGKAYAGDCALAKCCRGKGHEDCSSCRLKGNCGQYRSKEHIPVYRRRAIEAQKHMAEENARRLPFFRKWLGILFWLMIANLVPSVMTNDMVVEAFPSFFLIGRIFTTVCAICYCVVLFLLSREEGEYRGAAVCALLGVVVDLLFTYVVPMSQVPVLVLLLSLPTLIISLVQEYGVFTAHGEVLTGWNDSLAERWLTLRKWLVIVYCLMIGSVLLVFIASGLGALAALVGLLGVLAIQIINLVHLWRTVQWLGRFSG